MFEFSRVPYSDPKQKLVTVIEAEGGGGHLPVLIIDKKMIIKK